MNDFIVLLMGESGCGKSSVADELQRHFQWRVLQSYTTRPRRSDFETGHTFITDDEFDALENICAYTEFDGYQYGATSEQIDEADVYIIDPDGYEDLLENYEGDKLLIPIYLYASEGERYARMRERGDSMLMAKRRIWHDRKVFDGVEDDVETVIDADAPLAEVVANVYKASILYNAMQRILQEENVTEEELLSRSSDKEG